jgi:DNA helicase II / ATP-dependent DNA helicase PcrA
MDQLDQYSLDQLNSIQRQAVVSAVPHILVLAGAGSGKTRVLAYRIWWLIKNRISPHNILAVTFTNKAAAEMRTRLEQMLGLNLNQSWIGTFHGIAHRMLRLHWQEADLPQAFQIIDSDDQLSLLRKIHKNLNLNEEQWPAKQSQSFINHCKDRAERAKNINVTTPGIKTLVKIYQEYEDICTRSGLVDFAELLLRSYDLLNKNETLLEYYRNKFHHILIDEFQDTNSIQYLWIKLLAATTNNLLVVGDDDQSIYSWRGANVENMQHLLSDYPGTELIRLEQNYRSTANILGAANAVIAKNKGRMGKNLWTDGKNGDAIIVYNALNEIDEADYIAAQIREKTSEENHNLKNIAILYRSNAQSRVIEEQLLQAQIPYRIYGGLKFFERAEIKDVLAYLRLVANTNDDAALERIINVPARGIGETTLLSIRTYAQNNQQTMWLAAQNMLQTNQFPTRAAKPIQNFIELIQNIRQQLANSNFHELIAYTINASDLKSHYLKIKDERAQIKLENLDELINTAKRFVFTTQENDNLSLLNLFLSSAALESGDSDQNSNDHDCVQLMTLHSAKGLEFPIVFLCGLEEGLFPHQMSMHSLAEIEEERRLCYVGMTRAMQKLYMLHASMRTLYGSRTMRRPSRFLEEIPEEFVERKEMKISLQPTTFSSSSNADRNNREHNDPFGSMEEASGFTLGQNVRHSTFGDGTIIDFAGQGEYLRLHIKFKRNGNKWLSPLYAKLETF